ncbi:YkvA family protein [Phormidesmis priestleyi]
MKFFTQPLYAWYRSTIRNSKYRWLIILGSLVYLLSPLNILTDALPIVGWIDDGLIATLLVTEVSQILLEQLKTRKSDKATA